MKQTNSNKQRNRPRTAPVGKLIQRERKAIQQEAQSTRKWHAVEQNGLTKIAKAASRNPPPRLKTQRSKRERKADDAFVDALNPFNAATTRAYPPVCFVHTEESAAGNAAPMVETGLPLVATVKTGDNLVDAMLSGYATSADKMPDPYTCVKTFPTNCHLTGFLPFLGPSSGTTTYGGNSMLLMGSGAGTYAFPSMAPGVSDVSVAFNGLTSAAAGINNAAFISRPIGINATFTYNAVGPVHKVSCTAFPILPSVLTGLVAAPSGWPTTLSAGLNTVLSTWGGRQWQLDPGQSVTFHCQPLDNRSFDFEQSTIVRGKYDDLGQLAWCGWFVWFWGMTAGDSVTYRIVVGEECAYINSSATAYSFPTTRTMANPMRAAQAKDTFSEYMEKGFGAVKYAADTVLPIATKLWKGLSGLSLGMQPDTNPSGFLASAGATLLRPRSLHIQAQRDEQKHKPDEEKTEEQLEIVTPVLARRPSLTPSLAPSLSARRAK